MSARLRIVTYGKTFRVVEFIEGHPDYTDDEWERKLRLPEWTRDFPSRAAAVKQIRKTWGAVAKIETPEERWEVC